jgi:hypothetical protein
MGTEQHCPGPVEWLGLERDLDLGPVEGAPGVGILVGVERDERLGPAEVPVVAACDVI